MTRVARLIRGAVIFAGIAAVALAARRASLTHRRIGAGQLKQLYDSHFHLTNYIQQGINIRQFLQIMGTRVGRSTLFRHPLAAAAWCPQLRRISRPPTTCTATRLSTTTRSPTPTSLVYFAPWGRQAGALRSDDHRLQPGRHVRRRSHPPCAASVSGRLYRHR